MAIRNTRLILKNSDIVNRPLPVSLLKGEAIVNTADGIVFFSGITTSTSEWTPAGTGSTSTFFEVGSNLYDLRLRNKITQYQGQSGGSLSGKFLSGTTNGFVLADISDIASSVDSYTTGATWTPNTLTISLNNGKPNVPVTIDTFNGITLYGTNNINGDLNVTGTTNLNGTSYYNNTASSSNEIVNYGLLTAFSQTNDVYVTGNTLTIANNDTPTQSADLLYHGIPVGGPYSIVTENTFTTGGTWNSGSTSIDFTRNDGVTYSVSLSNIDVNDTFVTGGTVTSLGDLDLFRNDGVTVTISKVTYWTSGSTGTESIKVINSSGLDSTGDRAVVWGNQTLASGNDSTAWGVQTSATTVGSTSSGNQTLASGDYSHAEGLGTISSGQGSHAEGQSTFASGYVSHSEGDSTIASGQGSHAEGIGTIASGTYSHAEGQSTTTISDGSHAEGNSTSTGWRGFTVTSVVSGLITIADNVDYSVEFGSLNVLLDDTFYTYSTTNFTSPNFTIQLDDTTVNSGAYVADKLNLNSPLATQILGTNSHAEGQNTKALGGNSHAEGTDTNALGSNSHAEGRETIASGLGSHAEGRQTTTIGDYSHAEGFLTTAIRNYSHAEGENTITNGLASHTEGIGTIASGDYSHAEGESTTTSGQSSHAEGYLTISIGDYSHSQGSGTTASGVSSFASGVGSVAITDGSFIHSENSVVNGQRSVVLGGQNITGSTDDTVYVPYLNLNYVPTLNNSNTEILSRNSLTGQVEYTALSAFTSLDTYVTGFTYNPSSNTFTISQNQGQPDLTASISSVSGLTLSNLTSGRVVYVGSGGLLTDESGFEYNDGTDLLTVGNVNVTNSFGNVSSIGQGGLVIGSGGSTSTPGIGDLTIHGSLTVFGTATTVSTNELYVEDPQITLNYNPTGNTSVTSIASGLKIQDGDGISGDTYFTVAQMDTFTGNSFDNIFTLNEYTGPNGYTNRAWVTQLNDIVVRNTNLNNGAPDGARVLVAGDVLDGGSY